MALDNGAGAINDVIYDRCQSQAFWVALLPREHISSSFPILIYKGKCLLTLRACPHFGVSPPIADIQKRTNGSALSFISHFCSAFPKAAWFGHSAQRYVLSMIHMMLNGIEKFSRFTTV